MLMDIQIKQLAENYFEIARDNFIEDGYLLPAGFIVTSTNVFVMEIPRLKDGETKEAVGDRLQKMAAEKNASAVFFLTEAWLRRVNPKKETPEEVERQNGLRIPAKLRAGSRNRGRNRLLNRIEHFKRISVYEKIVFIKQ
jgi:hypothetical protein